MRKFRSSKLGTLAASVAAFALSWAAIATFGFSGGGAPVVVGPVDTPAPVFAPEPQQIIVQRTVVTRHIIEEAPSDSGGAAGSVPADQPPQAPVPAPDIAPAPAAPPPAPAPAPTAAPAPVAVTRPS